MLKFTLSPGEKTKADLLSVFLIIAEVLAILSTPKATFAKPFEKVIFWESTPSEIRDFLFLVKNLCDDGDTIDAIVVLNMLNQIDDSLVDRWASILTILLANEQPKEFERTTWGKIYLARKLIIASPESAKTILRKLSTIDDYTIQAVTEYLLAVLHIKLGQLDSAKFVLTSLAKNFGDIPVMGEVLFRLGYLNLLSGDYKASDSLFSLAQEVYGSQESWWNDEALFLQTVALIKLGEIDSAKTVSEKIPSESQYGKISTSIVHAYENQFDTTKIDSLPEVIRVDLLIHRGWELLDNHRYKSALTLFQKASSVCGGESWEASIFAAEAAYKSRDYELAAKLYSKTYPSHIAPYANWGLGWSLFRLGKLDSARKIFTKLSRESTFSRYADYAIARTYYAQRQYDECEKILSDYIKNCDFRCLSASYYLFQSQLWLDEIDKALATCKTIIKKYPGTFNASKAALVLAKTLFERGLYEELIDISENYADKLHGIRKDSLILLSERAKYKIGIYKDPMEILDGFSKKCPKSPLTRKLLLQTAIQCEEHGRFRDAIYFYTKAISKSAAKDSVWAEANLGIIRSSLVIGDEITARQTINKLNELNENGWYLRGLFELAKWFYNSNDKDSCVIMLSKIRSFHADDIVSDSALLFLAKLYHEQEYYSEEANILAHRLDSMKKSHPLYSAYAENFVICLWNMGFKDSALSAAFSLSRGKHESSCGILLKGAELALDEGEISIAGKLMDSLLAKDCKDLPTDFMYRMANAYVSLDRIKTARKLYTELIKKYPDDTLANKARERMNELSE